MPQKCLKQNRARSHGHWVGGRPTATWESWHSMKQRCLCIKHPAYHRYGGRGISVCERWAKFENFLVDMGERPKGKTLDRYPNSDGNYEPGNCRWATPAQQIHNIQNSGRNTSGYRGVRKAGRRWHASITRYGQWKFLGSYCTAEQAYEARLAAEASHA